MELIRFAYNEDRNLTKLKEICKKSGSNALKRSFEYLRIVFYHSNPNKVISEYVPNVVYYVATIGKNKIRLVDIGVNKEYQRKGIGRKIIERLKLLAKSKGIQKITLRTSSEETAFMFYQKIGFVEVGMNGNDIEMELKI